MNTNVNPEEYIRSKNWTYKPRGKEFIIERCPYCGDSKYHFSINQTTGQGHCFKCNVGGSLWSLKKQCGDFTAPEQAVTPNRVLTVNVDALTKALYENNPAKKFLKERGLASKKTIDQFKLGYDEKRNAISFPYFENKKLVNIKYRNIEDKKFEKEAGCRSSIFNFDGLNLEWPIIITEGEFDAVAAWMLGFENVCSLPDGASSTKYVSVFENTTCEIIIATDNDNDGENAAEKIANMLGAFRCKRLIFPNGVKDFNDALKAGMTTEDVEKLIQDAKIIEKPEVSDTTDMHVRMMKRIAYKPNVGMMTGWGNFDNLLRGYRGGEVTVLTADTGIGKTTWALNTTYKLVDKGHGVLLIIAEGTPEKATSKLYSIHSCKCFETMINENLAQTTENKFTKDDLELCREYYEKKNLLFWTGNQLNLQKCQDLIHYTSVYNDTKFILIDHLHYAINPEGSENERYEIEKFMRGIARTAIDTDTHIMLIVHPNKEVGLEGKVYMNMLKGSSAIKQEAANVISLYRDRKNLETDVTVWVQKCRDDAGKEGEAICEIDESNQRYSDSYKTKHDKKNKKDEEYGD